MNSAPLPFRHEEFTFSISSSTLGHLGKNVGSLTCFLLWVQSEILNLIWCSEISCPEGHTAALFYSYVSVLGCGCEEDVQQQNTDPPNQVSV